VLALIGGGLGIVLASTLLQVIMAMMPEYTLPSEADVQLNVPVLVFTLAACALSGILFGCAPAWQASRTDMNETLKESGRSVSGGRHYLRRALVVIEFALALTLLAGGGLAITACFSSHVSISDSAAIACSPSRCRCPTASSPTADQIQAFYRQLLERVQTVPGVTSAAVSTGMPVRGTNFGMPFEIAGTPVADPSKRPGAGFSMVTPGYFKTFGIPITRGREFTEQDRAGGLHVAIVNQTFVTKYFPNVDPLTQRLLVEELIPGVTKLGPKVEWQIVGVYGDVRNAGPKDDGFPEINVPFWQSAWPNAGVAVRTSGDPTSVQQSLAAVVRSMDADVPMADVKTMEQIVEETKAGDRFNTVLFAAFAGVALVLAALGIYGVMAFVVAQRTHEIGLRMALGAGRTQVLGQVLREGMVTALVGTVIGTGGAYVVGRAMQGMWYGVGAFDPLAFSLVALTLLASALVACLVPARRAASVDPMVALREQ
jgi:predicted permease